MGLIGGWFEFELEFDRDRGGRRGEIQDDPILAGFVDLDGPDGGMLAI